MGVAYCNVSAEVFRISVQAEAESMTSANASSGLVVESRDGVMSIRIAVANEGNRLLPEALAQLEQIGTSLGSADDIQAVLITGEGRGHFSTGILNPVIRGAMAKEDVVALVRLANRAFNAIEAAPQIVIAAINGDVRAGGAELALACDIRLAASHASMQFPEAAWGGFPGAGGPYRLASIVGRGRALELICSGRSIDAAEMDKLGVVQGIYPAESLSDAARALAQQIAKAGPLATRGAKRMIRARLDPGLGYAQDISDALRHELEWSDDVDEAIAAHREGRMPVFKGR
jgi:enoyl-CoA hydratase/carnithine racemase